MNSVELILRNFKPIENNFSINNSTLFCNSYEDKPKEKLFNKSFKFRIYPETITIEKSKNKADKSKAKVIDQELEINQSIGCGRYISNYCLNLKVESYKKDKISLSKKDLSKEITRLKQDPNHAWLKQPSSYILTQKLDDLMRAYKNFFEGRARFPQFKRKHSPQESIRLQLDQRLSSQRKAWENKEIVIPKIGKLKYKGKHPGKYPKMVTVTKESTGKYYVSFTLEMTAREIKAYNNTLGNKIKTLGKNQRINQKLKNHNKDYFITGLDAGINSLLKLSNGEDIENARVTLKFQEKLKKANRKLSKLTFKSNNWQRQKQKVARLHKKISNIRKDLIHKCSKRLIDENQVIVIEDLNIKSMMKQNKGKASKSIQDVAWGELFRQLEYKANWYGSTIVTINRYYPSSKTCSVCKAINHHLRRNDSTWFCQSCGTTHDRDFNASINIRENGIEELIKKIEFNELSLKQILPWGAWEVKHEENDVRSILAELLDSDPVINSTGKGFKTSVKQDNRSMRHENQQLLAVDI